MNQVETIVAKVEGPQGLAEVVEVVDPKTSSPRYEARFAGAVESFPSMGEAYITAKEKAGVRN
jgi:hypothetical protein